MPKTLNAKPLLRARQQIAELEALFELRWKADMLAIKRWQQATGRTMTWPDHADLLCWLMKQLDYAEKKVKRLELALRRSDATTNP